MKKSIAVLSVILSSLFSAAAQAHYLWLEPSENGARLYYGEADAALREKSPGKLDNFKAPQGFVLDAANAKFQPVAVSLTPEFFALAAPKTATVLAAQDESLEVRDLTKHGLGFAKSNYYARHGQPAAAGGPALALDMTGSGNHLTVQYRGQPLKDAKVEVIAPNTWTQEHKSDAKGNVQINTPWKGLYVVHVLHVDKTPGQHGGKAYESLRNHLTYTFVKAEGADPGPAVPPKHNED